MESGWLLWGDVGDTKLEREKARAVWKGGVRSKEVLQLVGELLRDGKEKSSAVQLEVPW